MDRVDIEINKYLDLEDERAEQLEEFTELTNKYFDIIEEALIHINNMKESYYNIDLDDEIKNKILEMLPK